MKYICFRNADTNKEEIILFPDNIHHDCAAEAFEFIRNQKRGDWKRVERVPISAGFTDGLTCYGESESLHLSSRPEDTVLLQKQLQP